MARSTRRLIFAVGMVLSMLTGGCALNDVGFDPARTPEMPKLRQGSAVEPSAGASTKAREIEGNLGFE